MAKGFLKGMAVSALGCAIAVGSILALVGSPKPPGVSDTVTVTGTAQPSAVFVETLDSADRAPTTGPVVARVVSPEPDTITEVQSGDTDPAAAPQTGGASAIGTPEPLSDPAGMTPVAQEAPAGADITTQVPLAPTAEPAVSISTDPAQPPVPEVEPVTSALAVETQQPVQPGAPAADADSGMAQAQADDSAARAQAEAAVAAVEVAAAERADQTLKSDDAGANTQPSVATASGQDTAPDTRQPKIAALPVVTDPVPAEPALRPTIGAPVDDINPLETGVQINRLPTADSVENADASAQPAAADDAQSNEPPLKRYAVPFENPDEKPLMAIVLMDTGQDLTGGTVGLQALDSFPYPITFAIDATLPDAAERMARYRADGFEVLAMFDLPVGATAVDSEVTVASTLATLPEVVGLLEGVRTEDVPARAATDQVAAILAATGHGLVSQNRGLNTAQKLADRAGVPSATVFRDFDAKDQGPTVIRRFLDQAAFRARQEGAVIMLGRLREDTISALLVWGLQDRASQVAMAPVSAVLDRR